MSVSKRFRILLLLVWYPVLSSYAQGLPTVAAYQVTSADVSTTITKTVNDLVFSFIRELRTYKILDLREDMLPADNRVPDGVHYLFYGTLKNQSDGIKLEIVLKGGPFAVTRIISRVYENSNRILLESRILVRDLFDQSVTLPDPPASGIIETAVTQIKQEPEQSPPIKMVSVTNIDSLAGSWYAGNEIEKVMILRGGRGIAVFSSGISISLELLISGGELIIHQKGNANPRQFLNINDVIAQQAALIAPPLEWRFLVSENLLILKGTKKSVIIKNDGKNILDMSSSITQETWSRE